MRGAHGRRRVALAGMLLAWHPRAFALNPALDVSQYAHTAWKISGGFSEAAINDITQTPDGYLWLGTDSGLLRFDGVKPTPWAPPPDQPLPSGRIMSLFSARDGTLWIGANKGLASWKDGRLTRYAELAGQWVNALHEDREGSVWAGTSGIPAGNLCAIQKGVIRCYGEDGRFGRGVLSLYEYQGDLWVGTMTGLWRWKGDSPTFYSMPGPLRDTRDLIEGDNGALWIALSRGIYQLVEGKAKPSPIQTGGQVFANKLLRDSQGSLWIGTTDAGLLHVHQGRIDLYSTADGLSGDTVQRLFEDREGSVWVATTDGLDRFREYAVPALSVKQGVSTAAVGSVLAARDGSVWLGSSDGLNRWKDGQFTIYRKRIVRPAKAAPTSSLVREINDDGLPDNSLESLFQDDRGRIWVSTPRGIAWFEDGRFTPLASAPTRMVHNIAEASGGNLWINDQDYGLLHLLGRSLAEQIPWEKLGPGDIASALIPDRVKGGIWLGFFHGGLAYFMDGRIRASITPADGLGQGRVDDFQLDRDGTLWAATEGGLSRVKNGQVITLTKKNGLPCDLVHWVIEDDDHWFWLYLACGLVRIARPDLDAWAANPNRPPKFTLFDNSDGVRNLGSTPGYAPRVAKSPDGKLWFVTYGGVGVIDPRHLPFNKLPPPVHIETVKINGKEAAPAEGMELSHRYNDLEIDYTALSLTIPERVRFRYQLEGKDKEWQDVGTRRQAFYGGLAPRQYRFRVMACNNDGVWNEAGATWNFSIVPAYYQTLWFQGLCVLGAAGLTWLLYRLRLRQMSAKLNLLYNERLAERTRIARDLHDTLLQSLAGVSLQLHGIARQAAAAPEKTVSLIHHVREQVDSSFREVRLKVWNLRSPELEGQGLAATLSDFAERMGAAQTPRCGFSLAGEPRPCPPEVEEELLRIAQEAANNASKHAQASEIRIALEYSGSSLTLSVSDDGCGFDLEEGSRKSGHWGLKNMQERAAQIRGKCTIATAVGQGTRIEISVPLSSWSLRNIRGKHAHSNSGS